MEPRARAGKNVGKQNFAHSELAQLLYSHGDAKIPLPDTIRILDEIATDFIQGVSFEATRAAHHAGRQKVKFEDFEFAMRRNPRYMGKIQEIFEKKKEIEAARRNFSVEDQIVKDEKNAEKRGERKEERAAEREERRREKAAVAGGDKDGGKEKEGGKGGGGAAGKKRGADEISKGDDDDLLFGDGDLDGEGDRDGGRVGGGEDELLGEGDDDLDAEADIGTALGNKKR